MKQYYLANTRSVVGNSVMWWAVDNCGYTCDIRCARVWTQDEINKKEMRECDVPYEKEIVDRLIQHHIDIQDLNYRGNENKFRNNPHTLVQWRPDLCANIYESEQPNP